MPVIAVRKDYHSRTMTLEAEFNASPERVWQLWADPRQLERWWGPPGYPATVERHDLRPGGQVQYHMIGPEGDRFGGYWIVDMVEPPYRLSFSDGYANADGTPNNDLPMVAVKVMIQDAGDGKSLMSIVSEFPSIEAMELVLATLGAEEGQARAVGQIDALLAGDSSMARGDP